MAEFTINRQTGMSLALVLSLLAGSGLIASKMAEVSTTIELTTQAHTENWKTIRDDQSQNWSTIERLIERSATKDDVRLVVEKAIADALLQVYKDIGEHNARIKALESSNK